MTITTIDGRPIDFVARTYVEVERMSKWVVTDVILSNGTRMAGPTVTKATWAKIRKVQSLVKKWSAAEDRFMALYKETRYMAVNGYGYNGKGFTEDSLYAKLDRMGRWEAKAKALNIALYEMGVTAY